jgi:subtilisin-like proprotein convertase family protein
VGPRARADRSIRRSGALVSGVLLACTLVGVRSAPPAAAANFANPSPIALPTVVGQAVPYPSTISVSGLSGTIADVNVTLTDITHPAPDDLDVLLVGPAGQNVVLMADSGSTFDITNVDLTFNDAAALLVLPNHSQIVSGTYRPTNHGAFEGSLPAPIGPHGSLLSVFNGTAPNGSWNLFIVDDGQADIGTASISGGWSLEITTNAPTVTSFNPTQGPSGASVAITGTRFTGTTSVTFGGVAAQFVVDGPTQITATVPQAAVTGPVAVTTANGTATSSTNFSVAPGPGIANFSPRTGRVGDEVVIAGVSFTGATEVRFDGVPAPGFAVDSDVQITVEVPAGAGTGSLEVVGPGGTAVSAIPFVVRHRRELTLVVGRSARGSIGVLDGFDACGSGVPVKVQRFDGRWRTVGSVLATSDGTYRVPGTSEAGRYRSLAKKVTIPSGDVCLKDVSPVVHR